MNVKRKDVIIVHDVDGRIYFEAIQELKKENLISSLKYRETSVVKRILSSIYKRKDFVLWLKRGVANSFFRMCLPFVKNKTIVLGIAPYNFRFAIYGLLALRNHVIYHTSWPYWWGGNVPYNYSGKNKILKKIYAYYINNFNITVVGVTQPCISSIAENLASIKCCHFIPHAVNIEVFKSKHKDGLQKKILYVGRLVKEKGIYELADAIANCNEEFEFTFVGAGSEQEQLKSLLNNRHNVKFLGHISNKSKVAEVFKNNDILVLPSKKIDGWEELFGLVIIEAMACGLIVIASDHIGPRGIIKHGVNGFLISDSNLTKNICDAITRLNTLTTSQLNLIRDNAIKTASEYGINTVKKKWLEVINNER